MVSFIKKDLLIIKANLKTFLAIFVIYLIMGIFMEDGFDISFLLPFLSVMLFISTFSYDEFNNWHAYAVTLPNGRKNVVKGKYVASFLLVIITSIVAIISTIGISFYKDTLVLEEMLATLCVTLTAIIFLLSIMFPIIFKFGVEKGRFAVMVIVFGVVFLISMFGQLISSDTLTELFSLIENWYYFVFPIFIVVSIGISYLISLKIYLKKEF